MWNNKLAVIIAVFLLFLWHIDTAAAQCTINVNGDLGEPQPLLIKPGTTQFFYPQGSDGIIRLAHNEQLELYCSAGFASPGGASNSITISCTSGNQFLYASTAFTFNSFTCNSYPAHTARKTGGRCYNNGYEVEIGFEVGSASRFLQMMTLCHDDVTEETYYTKYKFTPANAAYQIGFPRPSWPTYTPGFFGGKNVDNLYTRNNQRNTIAYILNSQTRAEFYIHPTNEWYMSRGHLAAKADFIFGSQHMATFNFLNVAPQWQRFNALNWESIEDYSKKLAATRNINLDVYTGTFGRLRLRDDSATHHEIFFYANGATRQIPSPMIFYKILIDHADSSGIVLIGVNNPYLTMEEIYAEYILCPDISDQITWQLGWQRTTIDRGYSYACSVYDFLRVVPHVSIPNVTRLLI